MESQEGERTPEEEYLDDVWAAQSQNDVLGKLGTSGGIYGHEFLKIVPDGIERRLHYDW